MQKNHMVRHGVCLDVGHVNPGSDVVPYIEAMAGRIASVHLQDNTGRPAHLRQGSAGERCGEQGRKTKH